MPSLKFGFDGKNVEAQQVAKKVAGELITVISEDTKLAIRSLIVRAIAEGIPPYDAARIIKPMIGLNQPQQMAVLNFRSELINSGLSSAVVDRKVARYIEKSLRTRAKTIARTEIIGSLAAGQELSYKQASKGGFVGKKPKKRWSATPFDACPICTNLNQHKPVDLYKSFKSIVGYIDRPTAHPNCRCAIILVPGKGIL